MRDWLIGVGWLALAAAGSACTNETVTNVYESADAGHEGGIGDGDPDAGVADGDAARSPDADPACANFAYDDAGMRTATQWSPSMSADCIVVGACDDPCAPIAYECDGSRVSPANSTTMFYANDNAPDVTCLLPTVAEGNGVFRIDAGTPYNTYPICCRN